jgi:flagellar L-ring protein precursor FlgH
MSKARPASQLLAASSLIVLASFTGGCSSLERIRNIGEQPALADIENPTTKPGYKPVHMPMPEPTPAIYNENSLWRSGSREFFKDQRAHQVGDILTITVNITDAAKTANETQRSRSNSEDSGISDFIGSKTIKNPGTAILPGKILTADSTASSDGKGSINRQEAVQTNVAAVPARAARNLSDQADFWRGSTIAGASHRAATLCRSASVPGTGRRPPCPSR